MTHRLSHMLLACSLAFGAVAHAQDTDDPPRPADASASDPADEAESTSPAADAEDAELTPSEPDPEAAQEEARTRFQQGVALARAGNCRGALAELAASYELFPRPNTLFNIAQCQEELHRYDLAVSAYERYLEAAPEDDPERATVTATMRALRNLLGTIRLSSNTVAEVWLDDRVVGESPGDVLVPGGAHVLELRATGFLPERREVQVAARRTVEVEVTLAEETVIEQHTTVEQTTIERTTIEQTIQRPPLPSGVFWGGVALSVVTAGVGGYFGFSALTLSSAERDRDLRLPPDTAGIEEAAILADVFYATAFVFAVATVIVALFTDWDPPAAPEETEPGEAEQARLEWTGASLEGAF
ncbi:MAG: tol-pal system YbgF family protein [Sandaracinaceae bacterium]